MLAVGVGLVGGRGGWSWLLAAGLGSWYARLLLRLLLLRRLLLMLRLLKVAVAKAAVATAGGASC